MTEQPKLTIKVRRALEADAPFIFNSWLKSYRFGDLARNCDNAVYFNEHHKVIERLLKRCETFIACAESDPATIYGYICFERVEGMLVVHYVYVKHTFRNMGIAKELMKETAHVPEQTAALYTHHAEIARKLQIKLNLVYHPYILINYGGVA
jgi:ribosomal protein S18 acetylase RimI-like enzyme